jgi:cytochrome P450
VYPQVLLTTATDRSKDFNKTISQIKNGVNEDHTQVEHATLFHEMLNSDLPDSEKKISKLQKEAQIAIRAGILTSAFALSVASFHLISNPRVLQKLRSELIEAILDPAYLPAYDWPKLEVLPYLSGVVREGIRLSYGVASRNPRVSHKDLKYAEYVIPAGTTISMTIVDVVHDEEVFPQSFKFMPERWIQPDKIRGNSMEKYFVGFGKGPRSCIGMNLAQAELYVCPAAIFRQLEFELFETDESDVLLAHDYFMACPKLDSLGIRAKVLDMVR